MTPEEFKFICENQKVWHQLWSQSEANNRQIRNKKANKYRALNQQKWGKNYNPLWFKAELPLVKKQQQSSVELPL